MRPRTVLVLLAGVVVLAGVGARAVLPAAAGGPAGDALYATLVVVLAALVRPSAPTWALAGAGFAVCVAIELFQLTGVPATLGEHWPPARLALGTTFAATDLVRYAAGAAVGGGLVALALRRRARAAR